MLFHILKSLTPAKSIFIIVLALVSVSCTRHVVVNVNSITDKSLSQTGNRYYMVNANDSNATSELYFQEFRTYFDYVLEKNGYFKVNDLKDADIEIKFHYGVSDGKTGIQHYSWPIYETFGGERITITERITDTSGGTQTINRTVYIPAHVRQVGSTHETQSFTFFNRYMNLAAFPANNSDSSKADNRPIWNTNIYSVGDSDDLRAIMPFMAAASAPFLGKNSGQQQTVTIANDDPLVVQLRGLVIP